MGRRFNVSRGRWEFGQRHARGKIQVRGDKEKGEAAKAKKLARPLQIVGEASQVTARGSVSPHVPHHARLGRDS